MDGFVFHSELEKAEIHKANIIAQRKALEKYMIENMRDSFAMWSWVVQHRDGWAFRRQHMMDSLNMKRAAYERATTGLRKLGLMKTIAERDPVTGRILRSAIHFYDIQNTYSIKDEISRHDVEIIKIPPAKQAIAPKSPDCRFPANIDHHISNTISNNEEMREAIPQSKCGDNPIAQRIAFTDQFDGNMIWQTFDDTDKHRGNMARVMNGDLWGVQDKLEAMNKSGAGVFVAVNEMNGSKRANAETKRVRFLVADFDGVDPRPAFKDKPHMIVESSPGKFHCYWKITDCPPDAYRQLQKSIIRKHGSDPAVCDLARVLRVPGFYHNKGEPFMTKLWYVGNHMPLTFAEAVELFPPEPVKKFSAPRYQTENSGDFRGEYGTSEGGRNNWLARRIGGMIKAGRDWATIESEAMKEAMACSPPLPEKEAAAVLRSMRRYA